MELLNGVIADKEIKYIFNKYLTKIRKMLIVWLAGKKLPVILNSKVYDDVIKYNRDQAGDILISNCGIERLSTYVNKEIDVYETVRQKGVIRKGNSFVLLPPAGRSVR